MHTWFFLYDEKLAQRVEKEQVQVNSKQDLCSSTSVPNLEVERSE